jgi:alkylhydroperoxidase/carboxymuconolactone decarboxylase family protein YurZ
MFPNVDPERAHLDAVSEHGVLGSWITDFALGDCWSGSELALYQRLLAVIGVSAALDFKDVLPAACAAALNVGVTAEELESVVAIVFSYAGLTAGRLASRTVGECVTTTGGRWPITHEFDTKSEEQRIVDGYDVMRSYRGGNLPPSPEEALAWFEREFSPSLGPLVLKFVFGESWVVGPLSRSDRHIVVVAISAIVSRPPEFMDHVKGALKHGVTRLQVQSILTTIMPFVGAPRVGGPTRVLRDLWKTLDAET